MKILDIIFEAGEPDNPSRRGFLKALGAAGLAAAVPGAAAQALSTPAAAAEVPAAAATAAGESGLIGRLWMAAADYWAERMMDDSVDQAGRYDYDDEDDEDSDDEDDGWDEDVRGPNEDGLMPWGEYYEVITTPSGHQVLHTSSPEGSEGIFSYEKDGEVRYIVLDWDHSARDYGEVVGGDSEYDADLYYAYGEEYGGIGQEEGLGELFDFIINDAPGVEKSGHYHDAPVGHKSRKEREEEEQERWWKEYNETHKPYRVYNKQTGEIEKVIDAADDQEAIEKLLNYRGMYWNYDPAKHEMFSAYEHLHSPPVGGKRPPERKIELPKAGTTAADIARLAGLAKRGYDAARSAGEPEQPTAAEPSKPQALPAPKKPDIDLTPDLKQKQQEPVKRKKDES